jgi:hypothetical protein
MADIRFFSDQNTEYQAWLEENRDRFVLNMGGFRVHDVGCHSIQRDRSTKPWGKACAADRRALEDWLRKEHQSEPLTCGHCTGR